MLAFSLQVSRPLQPSLADRDIQYTVLVNSEGQLFAMGGGHAPEPRGEMRWGPVVSEGGNRLRCNHAPFFCACAGQQSPSLPLVLCVQVKRVGGGGGNEG